MAKSDSPKGLTASQQIAELQALTQKAAAHAVGIDAKTLRHKEVRRAADGTYDLRNVVRAVANKAVSEQKRLGRLGSLPVTAYAKLAGKGSTTGCSPSTPS